jgi:hypothetical protein
MDDRRTTLTDRISFAEGWLERARRQIRDGQVAHGTLTMILAEAELHRAREAGVPTGATRMPVAPRARAWWAAGVSAAAAAALVALILTAPFPAPGIADSAAPSIVTLAGGTGEMFRIITVPGPVVERTVVRPQVIRLAAPLPRPAVPPAKVSAPQAVRSSPAAPPPDRSAPHTPPAPPAAVAAPAPAATLSLLSDADVIDLVLAAERSLRRSANQ